MKVSKLHFLSALVAVSFFSLAPSVSATQRIAGPTLIYVFTQSLLTSNAHVVEAATAGILVGCSYNRAYIDPSDRELLAAAQTAQATGRTVTLSYDDNAPVPSVPPHAASSCRIKSIF